MRLAMGWLSSPSTASTGSACSWSMEMVAGVAVVFLAFFFVVVEGDAKGRLDLVDWAAHNYGTPRQAGRAFVYGEAVLVGEFAQVVEANGSAPYFSENSSWLTCRPPNFSRFRGFLRFTMTETLRCVEGRSCPRPLRRMRLAFTLGKGNSG